MGHSAQPCCSRSGPAEATALADPRIGVIFSVVIRGWTRMPKRRVSRLTRSRAACGALAAIQNDPALPALVQSLSPPALAQLCSRVGISDATQIMAVATPEQLVSALEVTVWKSPRPGLADLFDRSELMEWLAAWLDVGDEFTSSALAKVPDANLVLYFSHVLRVTTQEMWGFARSSEIGDLEHIYASSYHESVYGPYVATALVDEHWEAVRAALDALWRLDPERVLHLFAQLSADESMLAPQKNRESSNDDFAAAREGAGERRGHVTAAGARAFLAFGTPAPSMSSWRCVSSTPRPNATCRSSIACRRRAPLKLRRNSSPRCA